MRNGWYVNVSRKYCLVDNLGFGFMAYKFRKSSLGLFIRDRRFGWHEHYKNDGTIDENISGFYLNGIKDGSLYKK